MHLVFAHDHKFRQIEGEYYSPGGLSNEVLARYADLFGSVAVLSRVVAKQEGDRGLSRIAHEGVTIVDASGLVSRRRVIESQVEAGEAVIARLPSVIGEMAVEFAQKHNKPCLIELVGCPWDALWNHSLAGKGLAPYRFLTTRRLVWNATHVLYVTERFLQSRYPSKGVTIGCSDVSLPARDSSVMAARLNRIDKVMRERRVVVGTTAAVDVKYKGQEFVISAISMLRQRGYDVRYELAGSGDPSYLQSIAEKCGVADAVHFWGSLPHARVFDFLDNIDIYVQPSKQEGLPRALVEAMSRGCPAMGARVGGIPELVSEEYLFRGGASREIALKIEKMISESMKAEAQRSLARARDYEERVLAARRASFYREFMRFVEEGGSRE